MTNQATASYPVIIPLSVAAAQHLAGWDTLAPWMPYLRP